MDRNKRNTASGLEDKLHLDMVSVRLVKEQPLIAEESLDSPQKAARLMASLLADYDREIVCVLHLSSGMIPISAHIASMGALNEAMLHPREIMKAAILSNAACMILFHNHPSGNLQPSRQDVRITDRMVQVCDLVGIPLADHIIIGRDEENCFSFRGKDILPISDLDYKTDYHDIEFSFGKVADRQDKQPEHRSLVQDLKKKEKRVTARGKDTQSRKVSKSAGVEL